jgi:hypothetical protein
MDGKNFRDGVHFGDHGGCYRIQEASGASVREAIRKS